MIALLLLLGSAPATLASPTASAVPQAVSFEGEDDFLETFLEAYKIRAREQMRLLVKQRASEAATAVVHLADELGRTRGARRETLEEQIAALSSAWREAHKSEFADKIYEYHSLMRENVRTQRTNLIRRYQIEETAYFNALEKKQPGTMMALAENLANLGDNFDKVGDLFYAANCFEKAAIAVDDQLLGRKGKPDSSASRACVNDSTIETRATPRSRPTSGSARPRASVSRMPTSWVARKPRSSASSPASRWWRRQLSSCLRRRVTFVGRTTTPTRSSRRGRGSTPARSAARRTSPRRTRRSSSCARPRRRSESTATAMDSSTSRSR